MMDVDHVDVISMLLEERGGWQYVIRICAVFRCLAKGQRAYFQTQV